MSKKKRKHYQVYEGLRCAMTLCFISGYVNAFTYMTQGKRFAGVQTGNLLSFAIRLSEQQLKEALQFLLPMIVLCLGSPLLISCTAGPLKKGSTGTYYQALS